MKKPYEMTVIPEPDAEWIAAAQEAIRPVIMPWLRAKIEEYIAEGRLVVEEYEGGRRWKYIGAEGLDPSLSEESAPVAGGFQRKRKHPPLRPLSAVLSE